MLVSMNEFSTVRFNLQMLKLAVDPIVRTILEPSEAISLIIVWETTLLQFNIKATALDRGDLKNPPGPHAISK